MKHYLDDEDDEDEMSLDAMLRWQPTRHQPVTGGNTGVWASLGETGFGNNLMAQQRAEMKSGEEKRKKLMGGGANYRGPGGGYR